MSILSMYLKFCFLLLLLERFWPWVFVGQMLPPFDRVTTARKLTGSLPLCGHLRTHRPRGAVIGEGVSCTFGSSSSSSRTVMGPISEEEEVRDRLLNPFFFFCQYSWRWVWQKGGGGGCRKRLSSFQKWATSSFVVLELSGARARKKVGRC